jgi:hypothetical protein
VLTLGNPNSGGALAQQLFSRAANEQPIERKMLPHADNYQVILFLLHGMDYLHMGLA